MKIEKEIAQKVLDTVDAGLCSGIGDRKPGEMCVEAAVCFAYGLPHGDNPPCVGVAVRAGKITLNDSNWSSNEARAKGMRKIAIAQLGSEGLNQIEYASRLAYKTIQLIVPLALRSAGAMKGNESHREKLQAAAIACEKCETLPSARYAASAASYAASAASDAASYTARYAASAASDVSAASYVASDAARAARAASDASAASDVASYVASDAASYTARAARYAASAASCAARAASYAASAASYAERDEVLTKAANVQLSVLIELNSPGCEFLYLTENL